jgi:hypothetical protein
VLESLQFHIMGPIFLGGMVLAMSLWAVEGAIGRRLVRSFQIDVARKVAFLLAIVWIGYYVVRLSLELTV